MNSLYDSLSFRLSVGAYVVAKVTVAMHLTIILGLPSARSVHTLCDSDHHTHAARLVLVCYVFLYIVERKQNGHGSVEAANLPMAHDDLSHAPDALMAPRACGHQKN